MPTKKRPGLTGVYVEIPDEVVAELEALCERLPLGGKADHIRLAVRRHLDNPPTVTVPPLPAVTVALESSDAAKKPRKRSAKK
jgi:hypothetical protein